MDNYKYLKLWIIFAMIAAMAMTAEELEKGLQFIDASSRSKLFKVTHTTTTVEYKGVPRYDPWYAWSSVKIRVNCSANCRLYQIYPTRKYLPFNDDKFIDKKYFLWLITLNWHKTEISPYGLTYLHVRISKLSHKFTLILDYKEFDVSLFLRTITGLLSYYTASTLSRSRFVFYGVSLTVGISLGSVIGLAVLFHYSTKVFPQKSFGNIILVGGIMSMLYLVGDKSFSSTQILMANKEIVAIYVLVSGGITFFLCYMYEPTPEDPKRKVIQWIIQSFAILLIYSGIQLEELCLLVVSACIIWSWQVHARKATAAVKTTIGKFRGRLGMNRVVATPRRYLTQDEFVNQGKVETEKALQQLRQYCTSPGCNTWRVVKTLKDPKRFAELLFNDNDLEDKELYTWMDDTMFEETDSTES